MSDKKQTIVETAFKLFSENGFYATGIDLIIKESGTAKRTFYRYFPSKSALVKATLYYYQATFIEAIYKELEASNDPKEKLLKLFDIAHQWYGSTKFNGCLAVSAANEYGNKSKDINTACQSFKEAERKILEDIVNEINPPNKQDVINNLMIILEGITTTAHIGVISPDSQSIRDLIISTVFK